MRREIHISYGQLRGHMKSAIAVGQNFIWSDPGPKPNIFPGIRCFAMPYQIRFGPVPMEKRIVQISTQHLTLDPVLVLPLAANLDHPGIVPIYDIGSHQGLHYFSMKLIHGKTLTEAKNLLLEDPAKAVAIVANPTSIQRGFEVMDQ